MHVLIRVNMGKVLSGGTAAGFFNWLLAGDSPQRKVPNGRAAVKGSHSPPSPNSKCLL